MAESFGVGVVGTGYVGLVTGTCLSHLGHRVVCIDRDEGRISALKAGCLSTSRASKSWSPEASSSRGSLSPIPVAWQGSSGRRR